MFRSKIVLSNLLTVLILSLCQIHTARAKVCYTQACREASYQILETIDSSIDPCDDFYKFACGGFFARADLEKATSLDSKVKDAVRTQIEEMLSESVEASEPKAIQGVKKLFQACTNEAAIERDGFEDVSKLLKELGGWPIIEGSSWNEHSFKPEKMLVKLRRLGLYYMQFFYFSVSAETTRAPIIAPTPLWYFYDKDNQKDEKYIAEIAELLGANPRNANVEAQEILIFKHKLSQISRNCEDDHKTTFRTFQKRSSFLDWLIFANQVRHPNKELLENEEAYLPTLQYLSNLEQLLKETDNRIIANYMIWSALEKVIQYLPQAFRDVKARYTDEISNTTSRFEVCTDISREILPPTFETLYVSKYFSLKKSEKVENIMRLVKEEFIELLNETTLYDEASRAIAVRRANKIGHLIGGPKELFDREQLQGLFHENEDLNTSSFLELALILTRQKETYRLNLSKTLTDDYSEYTTVNAYYNPLIKMMVLPAAILQDVYFNDRRPSFMNFGVVGILVGHELSHGFGTDANDENDSWTDATATRFRERSKCVVRQAKSFRIEGSFVRMNGEQVLEETFCDHTGVEVAYRAYDSWVRSQGAEGRLAGIAYSPKQLFWISAASFFCAAISEDDVRSLVESDPHAHPAFRVNNAFGNNKHFGEDFHCPLGSQMNPVEKCRIL